MMGNTDKFEMMATKYDTPERIEVTKVIATAIGKQLKDVPNKVAIDFGCGTGLVGLELVEAFQSVLFIDTSEKMLEVVSEKMNQQRISNGRVKCFDFEETNPFEEKVDVIFMSQVLLHIKDYSSVLERLYDVLNEEGHLIIVDFDKNENVHSDLVHNGFEQAELRKKLIAIGLNEVNSEIIYTQESLFMGERASLFLMQGKK